MKIELKTADERVIVAEKIFELCFTQTLDVACDSLWAYFASEEYIGEIKSVRAYENGNLIFNGYCDCQKNTFNKNGYEIYFYSRSSASMLVDNEAEPFTYEKPSAKQLCFNIARKYGFNAELDDIYTNMKYEVAMGTSCYGAINQFVSLLTNRHLIVTPDNTIKAISLSDDIKNINMQNVVSLVHSINRSEPYSQINFKLSSAQPRYITHTKSVLADKLGIERQMYINLSTLPQWQRENKVIQRLKSSYENYQTLEIKLAGYFNGSLLQRYSFSGGSVNYDDFVLCEKKYIYDKHGECTMLMLKKNIDAEELTYVDQ